MAEVFLSYSRTDRPIAQTIAAELQRLGVDVWWDHDLLGGDDYRSRISEVLLRAQAVIVIWSRRSVESQWVVAEAAAAREKKILAPINVDGAEPPLDFRPLHTLDFRDWVPGDQLPDTLLRGLGERLGREIAYGVVVNQGAFGRVARKATQSWYLDFESMLFYFIAQALACFLCTLPLALLTSVQSPFAQADAQLAAWMPYVFAVVLGALTAPLVMRPILQTSRLRAAVPIFLIAALLGPVSYIIGALFIAQLKLAVVLLVGPAALLMLLVTALADRVDRR
jgi:hypothetical protein